MPVAPDVPEDAVAPVAQDRPENEPLSDDTSEDDGDERPSDDLEEAASTLLAEDAVDSLVNPDGPPEETALLPPKPNVSAWTRRYDPLGAYIQEVRRYPILNMEEERALARQFRDSGDKEAAKRLVTSNLLLVVKIAREYRKAYGNLLDLVQEGNIGLLQAVKKYDPERGVRLTTYAAWWIRAYILKFIMNNWRLVKIGTSQAERRLFYNLRRQREKLERLGFEPGPKLLAEHLDVQERDVVQMQQRLGASEQSLDSPFPGNEEGERTRMDVLPTSAAGPDRVVEQDEFHQALRGKLDDFGATLEGRDRTIFQERLLSEEPKTLAEIGATYGITRERARQIEVRLIGKLKAYLREQLGEVVEIAAGEE